MNIVITVSNVVGLAAGAQKVAVELANYLSARGHKVTIISFEFGATKNRTSHYKLDQNVSLEVVVKQRQSESSLAKLLGRHIMPEEVRDEVIWYEINLPAISQLAEILKHKKPEVLITIGSRTFTPVAELLDTTAIPYVIDNQNDPMLDYTPARYTDNTYDLKRRNQAPQGALANVVLIEYMKDFFSSEVQKKTSLIPNPLDYLPEKLDLENSTRQPIILSIGRLESIKNLDSLIRSFSKIASRHREWELHIYGQGSLEDDLHQLINNLKMQNRVYLKGITKNIHHVYRKASIYAQPSTSEGLSLAMLEAMAHALPSVVIKECASNNSLISSSNGGVIATNNPGSIAASIEKLIIDEDLRNELGANARKYAANFQAGKVFSKWENFLLELKKKHRLATASDYEALKDRKLVLEKRYSELLLKAIYAQKGEIERQKALYVNNREQLETLLNSRKYKLAKALLTPSRKLRNLKKTAP